MLNLLIHTTILLRFWGTPVVETVPKAAVVQAGALEGKSASAESKTEQSVQALRKAQANWASLEKARNTLRGIYNTQLREVDTLKRSRASFRRDRQLREQKARTQRTAMRLKSAEKKQRVRSQQIILLERRLVAAIANERKSQPSSQRVVYLKQIAKMTMAKQLKHLKKIRLPDLELNEFADPEELLEQIALIDRAEKKLVREAILLKKKVTHFDHMAMLHRKQNRADALGAFEPTGVRHLTGRVSQGGESRNSGAGAQASDSDSIDDSSLPSGQSGGEQDFDSFEAASIVLADVVDVGTRDALRRAGRSASPKAKAVAAKRAEFQVGQRLSRLRISRGNIKRHLEQLRRQK